MLNPDFRDMLSAFADEGVEYLLVGAYALAVYGLPRATADLDLWVRPSKENAESVLRALERFGAPLSNLTPADFENPAGIVQIGVAPRRIDILTSIEGVAFEEAWPERKEVTIEGITIPVIGQDQLIRNKRASGRPQDQADVSWLEAND